MRLKVLKFRPELLAELLKKEFLLKVNVSDDAELVELGMDEESHEVLAVFKIKNSNNHEVESPVKIREQCTSIAKIGACRFFEDVKDRFAPEHRKVLSFDVKSGILFAKPVQALGYDWSEINNFVLDLGGRWVMDESSGHWESPLL